MAEEKQTPNEPHEDEQILYDDADMLRYVIDHTPGASASSMPVSGT